MFVPLFVKLSFKYLDFFYLSLKSQIKTEINICHRIYHLYHVSIITNRNTFVLKKSWAYSLMEANLLDSLSTY